MEKVKKFGLMVLVIRGSTFKVRNMVRDNSTGLMGQSMKENFNSTTSKASVSTDGLTVEDTKGNGKIIKWTEKE